MKQAASPILGVLDKNTEILDGELDGIELVVPGDMAALRILPTLSVTPAGISDGGGAVLLAGDLLSSHDIDLSSFEKPQLVRIAHQLLLVSVPECQPFEQELFNYIAVVSENYRENRFHNFLHAVTVMQCSVVLSRDIDSPLLSPMDRFGLYLSALVHDVNHPGHANSFEKLVQSPLAIRYQEQSILEHHHIAVSFTLMNVRGCNFIRTMGAGAGQALKSLMKSCILATDMMQHSSLVQMVSEKVETGFSTSRPDDRSLLCVVLVHSADLFNPIRQFDIAKKWAQCISDEFNAQAEKETRLGFPLQEYLVTTTETKLAENEIYFTNKFVLPLWNVLSNIFPVFETYRVRCTDNIGRWEQLRDSLVGNATA